MSGQYAFDNKNMVVYMIYFFALGIIALGAGIADLIVTISSAAYSWGILEIPSGGFRGGWGGLIMVFAGIFYLSGIRDANEIHQFAKVVLASVLIWVLAGTDIFSMIAQSIPSPQADKWLNSKQEFLRAYAPPYTPAVLILPFTLVITWYIHRYHKEKGIAFTSSSHKGGQQQL
jgi:hypothetical protein